MPSPKLRDVAPTTRYRRGARTDADAVAAHNAETTEWRRGLARAEFPPAEQAAFLAALAEVGDPKAAATAAGVSLGRVYGRARWDAEWSARLDAVLTAVCRADDLCGTVKGYRVRKGRCPACRAAKASDRNPVDVPAWRRRRPVPR